MMHMIANILFSHKKDLDIYLEGNIFGFSLCGALKKQQLLREALNYGPSPVKAWTVILI